MIDHVVRKAEIVPIVGTKANDVVQDPIIGSMDEYIKSVLLQFLSGDLGRADPQTLIFIL